MRAVVTGCAGFVGSTLTDSLLKEGHFVRGVDSFTPYYELRRKESNLALAGSHPNFELRNCDLRTADLTSLLADVDVVFHQAGQPGVRLSWSDGFPDYNSHNVLATQRLLEASRTANLRRFVFASSSSIYGNACSYPTSEEDLPRPHSPYGVTKLAAEHLCVLYAANWGVPTVSLRYFTVYGPRQRPDMAMHRLLEAALTGDPFPLYGSGDQVRDFTFVGDVVRANLAAADAEIAPGTVVNVAGGGSVTMNEVLSTIGAISGRTLNVQRLAAQAGDVQRTGGRIERASDLLGWEPVASLETGLSAHLDWMARHLENTVIDLTQPASATA